jgi:hypothetical protein
VKRDGDIASLFRKHAAKRQNVNPMPPPEATQEQERVIEENVNSMPPPPPHLRRQLKSKWKRE